MKQPDWQTALLRIAVILGGLLVVLASIALLYIVVQVLVHFGNVLVLFILGAIVAYVLNPAVNRITALVGKRAVGTIIVYLAVAVAVVFLAGSVVQPLVSESSSLVHALRNPTPGSLQAVTRIANQSRSVSVELRAQRVIAENGGAIPQRRVQRVRAAISTIQADLTSLGAPSARGRARANVNQGATTPVPHVQVPPSYLAPLQRSTAALTSDYRTAVYDPQAPAVRSLTASITDANSITAEAKTLRSTLSNTPILLLDMQTWADQHNIGVNVRQSGGQVIKKVSDQAASLLNNTAAILSQTATILLDLFLILIISVYLVSDGGRQIEQGLALVPDEYRKQATSFVNSVDSILGGYIRAQILLALLAGVLAGVGAAILRVPFPLVIGASTFVLQLLPVIGPTLVYIIPMVIALLFTSMPTPWILLGYLIVMEQIVTNVIGPRVNSKSVGIQPLEAMAAALMGYPIAGVLGSFLAVPIVGILHVVVKEANATWKARKASSQSSADSTPALVVSVRSESSSPVSQSDGSAPAQTASNVSPK